MPKNESLYERLRHYEWSKTEPETLTGLVQEAIDMGGKAQEEQAQLRNASEKVFTLLSQSGLIFEIDHVDSERWLEQCTVGLDGSHQHALDRSHEPVSKDPLILKEPNAYAKAAEYLLIISCSKRKTPMYRKRPAIEVYDGPIYRALRKRFNALNAPPVEICIISAKYGLIGARNKIERYDYQMTPQRAIELQRTVVAGVEKILRKRKYSEIFVNLGATYRIAIDGIERAIPEDTQLIFASGGIGKRTSQTVQWLERASLCKCQER